MKKIFLALALLLTLAGCNSKEPESAAQVNVNFTVDKLFTHEGCTVYRFMDAGRERYYTNCKGSSQWEESCGNNCNRSAGVSGGGQ
jgi:uncharacterized protein YceK